MFILRREGWTLWRVAILFGVTAERVRQITVKETVRRLRLDLSR